MNLSDPPDGQMHVSALWASFGVDLDPIHCDDGDVSVLGPGPQLWPHSHSHTGLRSHTRAETEHWDPHSSGTSR